MEFRANDAAHREPGAPPPGVHVTLSGGSGSAWRFVGALALGAFLWLSLLDLPRYPYAATEHDSGSAASFEYFFDRGLQYGKEVFQNTGPYGFVHYAFQYVGLATGPKIVLHLLIRLALVALLLDVFRHLREPIRRLPLAKLIWGATALSLPLLEPLTASDSERAGYLTVLLAATSLGIRLEDGARGPSARGSLASSALLLLVLALVSLTKHSYLLVALAGVASVAGWRFLLGERTTALCLVATYLGWVIALWALAGQQLRNLPSYLWGIWAFSGAYNEALATQEPEVVFDWGVAVFALTLVAIAVRCLRVDGWRRGLWRVPIEAGVLFLAWKHGFVRADSSHTVIFFAVALCLAPVVAFVGTRSGRDEDAGGLRGPLVLYLATVVAIFGWCATPEGGGTLRVGLAPLRERIAYNLGVLASPGARLRELDHALREQRELGALPLTRALVGDEPVDQFGSLPGWVLLNELNYRPRPMAITFAATTSGLQAANAAFYRDARTAPRFVLARYEPLEDHFLALEDGLAFRALLHAYRPVLSERGLLVLARGSDVPPEPPALPRDDRTIRLRETVELGDVGDDFIWARITLRQTWRGRLRTFLYKAPFCHITYRLREDPAPRRRRLLLEPAASGFLLSPMVEFPDDVAGAFATAAALRKHPSSFVVDCGWEGQRLVDDEIAFQTETIARPTYSSESPPAERANEARP